MGRQRGRRARGGKRKGTGTWRRRARWLAVTLFFGLALLFALRPRHLPPPPLTPPNLIPPPAPAPARSVADPQGEGGWHAAARPEPVAPEATDGRPRLAVVIDDLGDSMDSAHAVLALEPAVTVAVMPFRAASRAVAAHAVLRGREVILHLPLEPERGEEMGGASGFLRTRTAAAALERQLDADLGAVPYIVGVNGHMGSRFTSDRTAMRDLLLALRARGLFYLDSRTSESSVARETAAALGVPFVARTVFLDHDPSPDAVRRSLSEMAALVHRRHDVVAIGHPHPSTVAALAAWLPTAADQGIAVVPVSALVR